MNSNSISYKNLGLFGNYKINSKEIAMVLIFPFKDDLLIISLIARSQFSFFYLRKEKKDNNKKDQTDEIRKKNRTKSTCCKEKKKMKIIIII